MKINSSFGFRPLEFQPTKAPSTQGNGLSDDNIPSDDEYVYENSEDTVTSAGGSDYWGLKYNKELYDLINAFKNR